MDMISGVGAEVGTAPQSMAAAAASSALLNQSLHDAAMSFRRSQSQTTSIKFHAATRLLGQRGGKTNTVEENQMTSTKNEQTQLEKKHSNTHNSKHDSVGCSVDEICTAILASNTVLRAVFRKHAENVSKSRQGTA